MNPILARNLLFVGVCSPAIPWLIRRRKKYRNDVLIKNFVKQYRTHVPGELECYKIKQKSIKRKKFGAKGSANVLLEDLKKHGHVRFQANLFHWIWKYDRINAHHKDQKQLVEKFDTFEDKYRYWGYETMSKKFLKNVSVGSVLALLIFRRTFF